MKKVLVAGSTGYLGKYVVREFKRQGYWVRALARNPQKLEKQGPFLEPAVKDFVDEVFVGEITKPETLENICDDIDIVFSSIGITRQKDKLTFRDVDYQGNKNLLDIAINKSIEKFIFISVFNGQNLQHLAGIKAREDFVKDLEKSGLSYTIIRPTGYFSDASEFLSMAMQGRVYLIGKGDVRMNPIHGADLAQVCVDAVNSNEKEINIGGPKIFTYRQIAELGFEVLNKKAKITSIPVGLANFSKKILGVLSKQTADLMAFFLTAMTTENIAPAFGVHKLRDYFEELLKSKKKEAF